MTSNMSHRYLITGATGFVGSHLAETCKARGDAVTALVRPGSDTALLDKLGVTLVRGDLTDGDAVRRAVADADVVVHCAAKVGDWGPVADYRAVNVDGLRHLLEACRGKPLHRFVHVSSLGVYAARHHHGTDESEPLPAFHMDGYTQSKVEAEQLALGYQRHFQVPVVVLRPGFVYGPRDRTVLPKLIDAIRKGTFRWIGGGRKAMNTIYVANLIDAIFLAVDNPQAVGQIYNLTDGELISKRRFIESLVHGLHLPEPPGLGVPLWLARLAAWNQERMARNRGATKAPRVTQARVKFLGLNLDFSIEKAKRELGYRPSVSFERGMEQTVAFYKNGNA
jgi:nucleoside-diphosphate-sugar epimerase